jgi:hypothetical protein
VDLKQVRRKARQFRCAQLLCCSWLEWNCEGRNGLPFQHLTEAQDASARRLRRGPVRNSDHVPLPGRPPEATICWLPPIRSGLSCTISAPKRNKMQAVVCAGNRCEDASEQSTSRLRHVLLPPARIKEMRER